MCDVYSKAAFNRVNTVIITYGIYGLRAKIHVFLLKKRKISTKSIENFARDMIGYLNNPSLFRPELRRVIFLDRPVRERRVQVYGRSFRLVFLSFLAGYSLIKRKHRKCLQLR